MAKREPRNSGRTAKIRARSSSRGWITAGVSSGPGFLDMDQSILFKNSDFTLTKRLGERTENSDFRWPNLSGIDHMAFDTETTNRDLYGTAQAVGFSVFTPDRQSWYFPFGHLQGKNLDPDHCRRWAIDNLRGKKLRMAESKFDIGIMRKFDVDFEVLEVKPEDVQHDCALLDSRRQSYGLDDMGTVHLGKGKVKFPSDGLRIHERRAEDVDEYARMDVELTWDLGEYFKPRIEAEGLSRVKRLENDLIYSTCHMEREGLLLSLDKLIVYKQTIRQRYMRIMLELESLMGWRVIPNKKASRIQLWKQLQLPVDWTPTGDYSFTAEYMMKFWHLRPVKLLTQALQLLNFESKVDKYLEAADDRGVIRFRLHQLKAEEDEKAGVKGTVTGRYSSTGGSGRDGAKKGFNPQQVFKAEEQAGVEIIADMLIKAAFVAPEGMRMFSTDASQIEYRIFGHYVNSPSVTEVYRNDKWADFHKVVAKMTGIPRKDAKHANFAMLFGAGPEKFAYMIDKPIEEARPIYYAYLRKFPEVRPLLDHVMTLAETRGFVRTYLGRRRRFGPGIDTKYHAGMNASIQGTAADYNKLTVLDMYNNRKTLGVDLRLTFHDEELGYGFLNSHREAKKLYDFMQEQRMKLNVPILWNLSIDDDWAMQNPIWQAKDGTLENNFNVRHCHQKIDDSDDCNYCQEAA